MSAPATDLNDRERQLDEAIAEYFEQVESGTPIEAEQWILRHPQFQLELREFFTDCDVVEVVAAPLRAITRPSAVAGESRRLGDFVIHREIGRGGMGVVYEAEQLSLGRRVALKVLPFAAVLDKRQLQRFKNEAQAAAILEHPNIVGVYSVGCDRGVHYYAMKLVEGQSLAEGLEQLRGHERRSTSETTSQVEQPVTSVASPVRDTQTIAALSTEGDSHSPGYFLSVGRMGIQAAEALEYAHQLGIVHRDIKPSNLMVEPGGHLWITDFGLAQVQSEGNLTMTGDVLGTMRYMSPEQASGRRAILDHRTDIYSLGITLFEMATLQPAFSETDRAKLLRHILEDDSPNPRQINGAVPRDLETIILKATAKEPSARYDSAQELSDDLNRFLDQKPILARRSTRTERLWRWCRRNPVVATLTAAVLLLLCVLSVAGPVMTAHQASLKRDLAHELSASEINLGLQAWFTGNVERAREVLSGHWERTRGGDRSTHGFAWGVLETAVAEADSRVVWRDVVAAKGLEISPDGNTLAIAPHGSSVVLLDATSGHQRRLDTIAFRLAMSCDGVLACASEDGYVRFWDVVKNEFLPEQWTLQAIPEALVYTSDGRHLIAGLKTGEIDVWPPGDVDRFLAHEGAAKVSLLSDGVRLESVASIDVDWGAGKEFKLWNLKTGGFQFRNDLQFSAKCVQLSEDGRWLFVGTNGGVAYWDTAHWGKDRIVPTGLRPIQCLATTRDGTLITGGYDGLIRFWNLNTGRQTHTLIGHNHVIWNLVVSPDGRTLYSHGGDGTVRQWPLTDVPKPRRSWADVDNFHAVTVAFSNGGEQLLVAIGSSSGSKDGFFERWDVATGELSYSRPENISGRQLLAIDKSSGLIAVCGVDGVAFQNPSGLEPLASLGHSDGQSPQCVAYSDDGKWLAVACRQADSAVSGMQVLIWKARRDGKPVSTPIEMYVPLTTAFSLAFSPDASQLVVAGRIANGPRQGGELHVFSQQQDRWQHREEPLLEAEFSFYGMAFSPDGTVLNACDHNHMVHRWSFELDGPLPRFRVPEIPYCVAISPDGKTLASGHSTSIKLWDARTGDRLGEIPVHVDVASLAFSPEGRTLAWAGFDANVNFLRASLQH